MATLSALSFSLSAYDGHELPVALDSLARLGVRHAEVVLTESAADGQAVMSDASARRTQTSFRRAGLQCSSVRCALDIADDDALSALQRQMDAMAMLGARFLVLPAPHPGQRKKAVSALTVLSSRAQALNVQIALRPGRERGHTALPDALDLVSAAQLPAIGLDFHTADIAQVQPGLDLGDQFTVALAECTHLHLSDMRFAGGWFPVALGEGEVACLQVLKRLRRQNLGLTVDLPLRQHQTLYGETRRAPYRLAMTEIEDAVRTSLAFLSRHLPRNFPTD